EILSLRTFDLDTQRSGDAVERVTVLPVRSEVVGAGSVGAQHAAPVPRTGQRQSLLDLLPSDAVMVLDQESALGQEVERTWADAAHHLEVARRLGEDPLPREELFLEPAAWRARLGGFARVAVNAGDAAVRFSLAPPASGGHGATVRQRRRRRRARSSPAITSSTWSTGSGSTAACRRSRSARRGERSRSRWWSTRGATG